MATDEISPTGKPLLPSEWTPFITGATFILGGLYAILPSHTLVHQWLEHVVPFLPGVAAASQGWRWPSTVAKE